MSDLEQQWLLQLGLAPLPAMKATCKEIQRLLRCSAANYAQFADVIRQDPGFSLATLRALHSTAAKNRAPVGEISRALPLLGMTWLAETATTLPRINNQYTQRQRNGIVRCYGQALHAAYYACHIATQQNSPHANGIFTMALLRNMGEMALWISPSPIAQKIQTRLDRGAPINEAIASALDLTAEDLTAALRRQWGLDSLDPLIHQPDHTNLERKICIDLAWRISQTSAQGWRQEATRKALELAAAYLGSAPEQFTAEIHRVAATTARRATPLGLPCSAFELACMAEKIEPPPAPTAAKTAHPPAPTPAKDRDHTPASDTPATQRPPAASRPLRQILSRTMRDIQNLEGLSRVVFIAPTPDQKQLATRITLNGDPSSKIAQFKTGIGPRDLFSLLLRRPQSIWMTPEKWAKHARLVPRQNYCLLESENFFAMSLFSRTRPIGLLYTDNGPNSTALDKAAFHNFKRLCQRISNELKQ